MAAAQVPASLFDIPTDSENLCRVPVVSVGRGSFAPHPHFCASRDTTLSFQRNRLPTNDLARATFAPNLEKFRQGGAKVSAKRTVIRGGRKWERTRPARSRCRCAPQPNLFFFLLPIAKGMKKRKKLSRTTHSCAAMKPTTAAQKTQAAEPCGRVRPPFMARPSLRHAAGRH
jgi:hypothetical protein